MRPIQILMDEEQLESLERMAKRLKSDRSKIIRTAVDDYLKAMKRQELEARHRAGYEKHPQNRGEARAWEGIQKWPEE